MPVERDQSVGLKPGQGGVLGVKHAGPAELAGDLPGDVLEDTVPEQPDPQPAQVARADRKVVVPGQGECERCLPGGALAGA
jgi:hypothetical protein